MQSYELTYRGFGDRALLIEWPEAISEAILNDIMAFSHRIEKEFPELERVPAYNSLTLIAREPIEADKLMVRLKELYKASDVAMKSGRKLWNIPVCYEAPFCTDLEEVARSVGLTPEEVVALHTGATYTVYAIGFLPGFMYLGGLPEAIHVPRRSSPRLRVDAGAVGIGGRQTGIYPQESPGGWNIIGNSPIKIFNAEHEPPCGISVGDKIRFYAIDHDMHELFTIQVDSGVFQIKTLELDDQSS